MIDTLHFVAGMKIVPRRAFVGVDHGALGNAGLNPAKRRALAAEHGGH